MRAPRAQIALAAVALVLGLLVVVQLRAQSAGSGLGELSAQELTVLVANLNERNDQLRAEIATLERQAAELASGQAQGETSVGQLQQDLARVRGWGGLDAVTGMGIRVTVGGPIPGAAVEDVLNELRNSGAEALAVAGVRVVPGSVVAGPAGSLSVENTALGDPFEISAIGNPEALTGALTRAGGLVAQLAATYPDVALTVIPVDRLELPATERALVPEHGRPRL
jgi:uncharacterized protein YlxW (UPF0749 family)